MGHGGMTFKCVIRNSLPYIVGDMLVIMGHGEMMLIGEIRNCLLYTFCVK